MLRMCFIIGMMLPLAVTAQDAFVADTQGYQQDVVPFLTAYCQACHGAEVQEGEFRVDQNLPNDFLDLASKQHWSEVVDVLNSHSMPPEDEKQPSVDEVAKVVDWITSQMVKAELSRRDSAIVLRRMNRQEYKNTIRDLVGIDFDVSGFPEDPMADGFDNNGNALTLSPLLMELYLNAAERILDQALVSGEQPPVLKWRFEPESGDSDRNRVEYDDQRLIVNGGNNRVEGDAVVLRFDGWDRTINVRDFRLPNDGEYIIRIKARAVVPNRNEVVAAAQEYLQERLDKQMQENPKGEKYHRNAFDENLEHFRTNRIYDYGPPRLKVVKNLGGTPSVVGDMDVTGTIDEPQLIEIRTNFKSIKAGITLNNSYSIPKELENFWMQTGDKFARPEIWVDWFEIEGPMYASWPPESHARLLLTSPNTSSSLKDTAKNEAAKEVIGTFMKRAYRRPVSSAEVAEKFELFKQASEQGQEFQQAIRLPIIAVLASPKFLYLTESSDGSKRRKLDDYELASRLSYFLWSSMPDDELLAVAKTGQLKNELKQQTARMLRDPKSAEFVINFSDQWLGLRAVGANPPAEDLYPKYDRHLEVSIIEEARAFFDHIMRNDLDLMNFVSSDFVVINERLGRFYGIPDVRGDHFRAVPVPQNVHRGGVVTQAAMLTITSNGTRTSPVKRGTWVMKNVLGIDPGLPVANAGDIAPKVPGIDKATVRQRLQIHRELAQCARCHNNIDPLGFALENFNAAGEWRSQEGFGYKGRINENDPVIDASAKMIDGTEFVGVDGLREVLLQKEDLFLNCITSKMLTYALGRELGIADQPVVKKIVNDLQSDQRNMAYLIEKIIESDLFQTK